MKTARITMKTAKNGARIWYRHGKRTTAQIAQKIATQLKVLQAVFDVSADRISYHLKTNADFLAVINLRIDYPGEKVHDAHPSGDWEEYEIACDSVEEAASIVKVARELFKGHTAWDVPNVTERFLNDDGTRNAYGFFRHWDI